MVDSDPLLCGRERSGQCAALAGARHGRGSVGKGRGLVTITSRLIRLAQCRACSRRRTAMQVRRTIARGGTRGWYRAFGQCRAGDCGFALVQRPMLGGFTRLGRRIDRSGIARQAKTDRPDQATIELPWLGNSIPTVGACFAAWFRPSPAPEP